MTCMPFRIVKVSVPSLIATPAVVLTVALRLIVWSLGLNVADAGAADVPLAPLMKG